LTLGEIPCCRFPSEFCSKSALLIILLRPAPCNYLSSPLLINRLLNVWLICGSPTPMMNGFWETVSKVLLRVLSRSREAASGPATRGDATWTKYHEFFHPTSPLGHSVEQKKICDVGFRRSNRKASTGRHNPRAKVSAIFRATETGHFFSVHNGIVAIADTNFNAFSMDCRFSLVFSLPLGKKYGRHMF